MQHLRSATTALALMIGLGLGLPAVARSQLDRVQQAKITADLAADGYAVRRFNFEDEMIEVYALKAGKMYEIYIDETGKVADTKKKG